MNMATRRPMFSFFSGKKWSGETQRIMDLMPEKGIFLTGIEGSDPQIDGVRRNQLKEAHDFYTHYKERLQAIRDLGITWLRFGPPYSQVHIGPDTYDFSFIDKVVKECDRLGITVMADLLHFGLPDWLHEQETDSPYFQNNHFPEAFAKYAATFAKRYPHIQYYTIVNEPFVTAFLSAKLGAWNEQGYGESWDDDRMFVRACSNIARAAILGRQAIEQVWKEEKRTQEIFYVQNESFEKATAGKDSGREREVQMFHTRRFVCLDLIFGNRDPKMEAYLLAQGMNKSQYEWFMAHGRSDKTILGIDHYPHCVYTYNKDHTISHRPSDPYKLYDIVKEYWNRYPLPLLHTEVNGWPEHAVDICKNTYNAMLRLKNENYPVVGMGWYGDDLQIGWHVAMRGKQGFEETPVGLFYKGQPQPVSVLFKQLAEQGLTAQAKPISFPSETFATQTDLA